MITPINPKRANQIISDWIGTPYAYRMRAPGVGVDCINLVAAVLDSMGKRIPIPDYPKYWTKMDPNLFDRELEIYRDFWEPVDRDAVKFGDIVLMSASNKICHCGVVVNDSQFMHVMEDINGRVRLQRISVCENIIKMIVRVK